MFRRLPSLLLLVLFAQTLYGFAKPADGTLRFELYQGYLMVVHGSAGPLKGLNFLLDTGASPSVLDTRLASRLHLERSPARVRVVGGMAEAEVAIASDLVLGPVERARLPVQIEDLSFLQKALPVRIDGIVGLDTLGQSSFVIDYVAREIHFGAYSRMPFSVPLRFKGGLAVVEVEVNRVRAQLMVDTGASALTLFARGTGTVKDLKVSQSIGEFTHKEVTLRSLRLGGTEFGQEPASVVLGEPQGSDFDGLVSPAVLGMRRVAFDLDRSILEFSR